MRKLHLSILALSLGLVLAAPAFAEPQPHMKAAIKHLEEAKTALEKASADKGGHRVKAIELVNEAIKEVKEGIDFDNKH
jgi:hypothetical protein